MKIFPKKLNKGDGVRVISPARSLAMPWITEELKKFAIQHFDTLWLSLSFSRHIDEIDDFHSSSIQSRIDDLHEAFRDDSISLIITTIWGFNSNQLLEYIDYEVIQNHPKILCGYSDITALANALYAKTGLVTYSGPHFTSFGNQSNFDYTLDYFKKCLFSDEAFEIYPSPSWSDDSWMKEQKSRNFLDNEGFWILNEGIAEGTTIGGNQCTLNLLQWTQYMPDIRGSILFLEDDLEAHVATIDRDLQSLIHQPGFEEVRGIVFWRFQQATKMTQELLRQIIQSKKQLQQIPIIGNVDFGHTTPMLTFPIGWYAKIAASGNIARIEIIQH